MRFWLPAAGKTGSSHDAWFAGYTTNLVCIVWVGHDDYTDIKIEGAKAAAPIWAEFMVRASKYARYNAMRPFTPPPGVVQAHLDKVTNLISTPACPDAYDAYFLEGTAPTETCTGGRDKEGEPGKKRGFSGKRLTAKAPPTEAVLRRKERAIAGQSPEHLLQWHVQAVIQRLDRIAS